MVVTGKLMRDPRLPGLATVLDRYQTLDGVQVTVGIQGTPDLTAAGDASASELVRIAAANEYGTDTIPPRPFLRTSLKRHRRRWSNLLDKAVLPVSNGKPQEAIRVLRLLGVVMVGDVQATLRGGPWIPNAELTVKRKGSSLPLVDTGQLVQSIRALVERPGATPLLVG